MNKIFIAAAAMLLGAAVSAQTAADVAVPRKSVSILGDSYSTYDNYVPDGHRVWYKDPCRSYSDITDVTQTWWHKYIKENGYKLDTNNSYSGSTICNTDYNGGDATAFSFVTRHRDLGNPDIIFIFGGTNDAWAGVPIGETKYEGQTTEELFQFRPALAWLLKHTVDRYPNTQIYFILNDSLGKAVPDAIHEICAHYSVPVIDLVDIDKMEGHPTVKGMQQIVDQLNAAIK